MVKGKVIFEDEEKLKDVVEYYFEICTPNNSINPFSLVALPNANTLVSIYLSDSSQTFKVHREHGIIDTSGDKISGSLTEAITVIHAPGTHEFSIKFKPGVLYSCLSKDISTAKVSKSKSNRRTKIKKLFCRASSVCRELAFK